MENPSNTLNPLNSREEDITLLCEKVLEVLNNNDWPTEEGHDREDQDSYIRVLVQRILERGDV